MSAASDFRLYHGNDLSVLAGVLAAELAKPCEGLGLLAPDTILIPQPAMKRWLQKTLAAGHGIAANLRFLTPGEFVSEALKANLPDDDRAVAAATTLRWRVWSVLADEDAMQAPVFAPLRPALRGPDRALAAWALAGEVAVAFEKYQAWRRGWLLRWDDGADPGDWQAELWRRATAGLDHRARRLHAYLQKHDGEAAQPPRGLPPRVFAFACQNVSPDVLRVIASVARAGELHFFFVSPVRGWWGDLPGARARLQADADGVFAADRDHPLLIANGAAGRDFVNLLFAGEAVHPRGEIAAYAGYGNSTLLHEMQDDLLERRPAPAQPTAAFDPADRSLQLHACHTPLREVQVLHEQLRTLLEADPTLQPRDIAVLTPDIDAYAPLVHAVFGAALGGPQAIPFAVADGSTLAARPLATWWLQLLALPASRFTLPEGLALLAPAPVLQRLGLDAAALQRLGEALRDAGARWGRDPAQRRANGAPGDVEFTWQWALDRLLLGHATGSDGDLEGLAPCPQLEGGDFAALDGLLAGLRALAKFARELATPHPAAEWQRVLESTVRDLLPERAAEADDRLAIDDLLARIATLGKELDTAQPAGDVPSAVIAAWFHSGFAEADTRQPFLTGGVTFGRMVPMRLIPFRVICLLGMDDGAYPRRDPGGALNRLAAELRAQPRTPGDRSVREDDRFLFLQLFAAAGDVFYLSFVGSDPRSGEPRSPSVVVAELLDAAAKYRSVPPPDAAPGDDAKPDTPVRRQARAAGRLLLRHPLHPFAPQAFGVPWPKEAPEAAARRRPWHADWRAAAETAGVVRTLRPPFVDTVPAPLPAPPLLTRDLLLRALRNPPRHFLQQRLNLRLPLAEDPLPESEPFALDDARHRFGLAQRVFAALRAGDGEPDALRRRLLAKGWLPPGPAGVELLANALDQAGGCARAARRWAPDPPQSISYELDLAGTRLSGRFDAVHARGLVQFRPGKPHGGAHLEFGLDHLLWHAMGEARPVYRLVPGESPRELPLLAPEAARVALEGLVGLAQRAANQALPLMPKSAWAWHEAATSGNVDKARSDAARQWTGGEEGAWAEGRDPWVRLALRGHDPFLDGDASALQEFGVLATTLFAAFAAEAAERADD